jgi:tight adherence protein B
MPPLAALALLALTLVVAVSGVWSLARGAADTRAMVAADDPGWGGRSGLRGLLAGAPNRAVRRTRWGHRLENRLAAGKLEVINPAEATAVAVIAVLTTTVLASFVVALWVAVLLGVGTVFGLNAVLNIRKERQHLRFVAQMPELARVLSNATSAGLSIRTAIEMAGEELTEPAKVELQRCARSMAVGTPLDEALLQMEERLPGRELSVLVGTLVIANRSGGSLIGALRDISSTLEDRKELKREVRTMLTQATYTGYLVVGMGVGLLFLINGIQPGLLRTLTSTVLGVGALAFATLCFGVGLAVIRRMTRIDA